MDRQKSSTSDEPNPKRPKKQDSDETDCEEEDTPLNTSGVEDIEEPTQEEEDPSVDELSEILNVGEWLESGRESPPLPAEVPDPAQAEGLSQVEAWLRGMDESRDSQKPYPPPYIRLPEIPPIRPALQVQFSIQPHLKAYSNVIAPRLYESGPSSLLESGPSSLLESGPSSQLESSQSSQLESGPSNLFDPGPSTEPEPGPSTLSLGAYGGLPGPSTLTQGAYGGLPGPDDVSGGDELSPRTDEELTPRTDTSETYDTSSDSDLSQRAHSPPETDAEREEYLSTPPREEDM